MDILGLFLAQSTCVQSNCKNSSHRKSDSLRHFCNLKSCQKRNLCNHDIFCRPILFVSVVLVAVPSCCSRHLRIVGNHLKTTPHNQRDHICIKKKISSLLSLSALPPSSVTYCCSTASTFVFTMLSVLFTGLGLHTPCHAGNSQQQVSLL